MEPTPTVDSSSSSEFVFFLGLTPSASSVEKENEY